MNEFEKIVRVIGVYSREYRKQDGSAGVRYAVEVLVPGVGTFRCDTFPDRAQEFKALEGQETKLVFRARAYKDRIYYTALRVA